MRHRDIHVNQSPKRMYALGLVGVAPITREAAKSKCMAVGLLLVAVLGREADGGPGYWALTRYEDVRSVSRNHSVFSNEPSIMIADVAGVGPPTDDKMMKR